jgi:hypothetical protein
LATATNKAAAGGGGAPSGTAGGDLGGTYPNPTVIALHETGGAKLTAGAIADGSLIKRSGTTLIPAVKGTDFQQVLSTLGRYFTTGQALAGLSATDCAYMWEDFMLSRDNSLYPTGYYTLFVVGGTGLADAAGSKAGVFRIRSTATAGSNAIVYSGRAQIGNLLTDRWYIAGRAKIPTPSNDAQTTCGLGTMNIAQGNMLTAGANGGNTTNFSVSYNSIYLGGSVLDLGLALDTAFHVYEMWGLGDNKVYARIDGGATVSGTLTGPADAVGVAMIARNGTTAADRELDTDWLLVMTPRL